MPSPVQQWLINGNGDLGILNIVAVDEQGTITATVYGQQAIGFWDDVAKRITFTRLINPADPTTWQTYTGFLIEGTSPVLTGYFDAFSGAGGGAGRFTYGWKATKGLLLPPR